MTRLYEGMFVLDNQLVREDWKAAKAVVTAALEKHGGTVRTARRWDERRLAYPIAKRQRGTYLLTYFDIDRDGLPPLNRDLELAEPVLRHLILQAETVPEAEVELTQAEAADDFQVPAPPPDDQVDEEETPDPDPREARRDGRRRDGDRPPRSEGRTEAKPEAKDEAKDEAKPETAEAKAEGEPEAKADAPTAEPAANAEAPTPAKES